MKLDKWAFWENYLTPNNFKYVEYVRTYFKRDIYCGQPLQFGQNLTIYVGSKA